MTKISQLPVDTTPLLTDIIALISAGTTSRASLNDLKNLITPQRLRRAECFKTADNVGGATLAQQEANEISFTGTATGYGRLDVMIPMDYVAGTTATINLIAYSGSANNQTINYYVGAHPVGSTVVSWNVQNAATTTATLVLTASVVALFTVYTIPASFLAAGTNIVIAFKPTSAITGTILITAGYIEYTANN